LAKKNGIAFDQRAVKNLDGAGSKSGLRPIAASLGRTEKVAARAPKKPI
jgi:hypothetical protein